MMPGVEFVFCSCYSKGSSQANTNKLFSSNTSFAAVFDDGTNHLQRLASSPLLFGRFPEDFGCGLQGGTDELWLEVSVLFHARDVQCVSRWLVEPAGQVDPNQKLFTSSLRMGPVDTGNVL